MAWGNYIAPVQVLGKRFERNLSSTDDPIPLKRRKDDSHSTPDQTPAQIIKSQAEVEFPEVNPGEQEFLANLDNYIPLGSWTLRPFGDDGHNLHQTEWKDLERHFQFVSHNHSTPADLKSLYYARMLADRKWIRILARKHQKDNDFATVRVYALPEDVGRRYIHRESRDVVKLRGFLMNLVVQLDASLDSWDGYNDPGHCNQHYKAASGTEDSLFYLFNTIPSPATAPFTVKCPISNEAIRSVFDLPNLPGLKTQLYPYQKRTIATMVKREVEPARSLDPRFEALQAPTGQYFFYDRQLGILFRDKIEYDEACGGILGESMGLGKTLICLATVLATKGHWPAIPAKHSTDLHPVRSEVGSLMQMAAAAVNHSRVPWRTLFHDLSRAGEDHKNCLSILKDNTVSYVVPEPVLRRSRRSTTVSKGKKVRLSTATLIIVPQNLLSQWKDEISLHIQKDFVKILTLSPDPAESIPPTSELLECDIILLSRQRFEREMVPSENMKAKAKTSKGGCRCSLDDDCHCSVGDEYHSPLRDLHFLRIIMDEGHGFSSSGRKGNIYWALQNLSVDRKWIVSGTPANGLLGVEVGTATYETSAFGGSVSSTHNLAVLEARRKESALAQDRKDLETLGIIVAGFLQVKPWANSKESDWASWRKYIMPYEDGTRKVGSLKTLLESLVVRHRIEDIEADIQLPPLHNQVTYLQPSWHDKLSINLFILSLTANAVTSERVDEDYMFHPKNRKQLNTLIQNLRQSGFYWTSFSPEDIAKTLKVSRAYLEEHTHSSPDCTVDDHKLLESAITMGETVLESASWRSFADFHEMGMFVQDFPAEAREAWSLVSSQESELMLVGSTQLSKAQSWVDEHSYMANPLHGLADFGHSTRQKLLEGEQHQAADAVVDDLAAEEARSTKANSQKNFLSSSTGTPRLRQKQTVSRAKGVVGSEIVDSTSKTQQSLSVTGAGKAVGVKSALKSAFKKQIIEEPSDPLKKYTPSARSRLSGTASAKLSYLIDKVTLLHESEKVLIFYDGNQIAWYIAQAFDLLNIRYLIYTKTLSTERQTAYITTFNKTDTFRVLLMDVSTAAHGLHIASASRVFFVNPVWQPNVEAQAIKRAHRIGQVRPVYVETLVLEDTLEDQMLRRRKGMSAQEHQKAEKSLLDDATMSTLIKNAQFIPLSLEEIHDVSKQVAKLKVPQQLFGRSVKSSGNVDDPDADLIFPERSPSSKNRRNGKDEREAFFEPVSLSGDGSPTPIRGAMTSSFADDGNTEALGSSNSRYNSPVPTVSLPFGKRSTAFDPSAQERADEAEISNNNQAPDVLRREEASSATANASGPRRRVAFALGSVIDEPPSLFGGSSCT